MNNEQKFMMLDLIVSTKCRNGIPFTSVCISNELIEASIYLSNRQVEDYLIENIENISYIECVKYENTLISVKDGFTATLYHPKGFNSDLFVDRHSDTMTSEEFINTHFTYPY